MFFLFNDVIFDIGDARQHALDTGQANGYEERTLSVMRASQVVPLVKQAVFDQPELVKTHSGLAAFLGAMVAWKTNEANALIAVRPADASVPNMVAVRFASVSLVTMAQLSSLQTMGKLNNREANKAVWSLVP